MHTFLIINVVILMYVYIIIDVGSFYYYRYYLGFYLSNDKSYTNISILLTSTETHSVQYFIEIPGVNYYYNGTIAANDMVIINLPTNVEVTSVDDQDKGIYFATNSGKVTVIGQTLESHSSDSYLALPIGEIADVLAYVYYGISTPRTIVHSYPHHSSILVAGTENNTIMKLISTQPTTIKVGSTTTDLIPHIQYTFMINRLQTIYIRSLDDLTGTNIITDKPVSVFSGHECGNVPWDTAYCSHLIEQIPPTALWGKVYYTGPLFRRSSYTITVLAAFNSTIIDIYCNNSVENHTINEGEFINKVITLQKYCAVYSNKKILVVQFSHGGTEDSNNDFGDPMMTLVPSNSWYLNELGFSTTHNYNFNHFINIIVTKQYYQPNLIYLTTEGVNMSLAMQHWEPIQVNNITEVYTTQVSISQGMTTVFHSNPTAHMMVIVYGFSRHDSYGHLGGINLLTAAGSYIAIIQNFPCS